METTEQLDQRQKLLVKAEELFMRYGFKSITMDDLAREMGISKKTLYHYFSDKNELVNQAVDNHLNNDIHSCRAVAIENSDPIYFMLKINEWMGSVNKQVNHSVLFDLKKYFKEAWDKIEKFRTEFIYAQILENIERGMEMGLYRPEIHAKLIARMYVQLTELIIQPEIMEESFGTLQEQHFELIQYHLRGICTEKGLKILTKRLSQHTLHKNIN